MGTGIINSLTIGDSPIDPMDITIDDIRRVSQLRIILSDSYLGSMHTKSEEQRDADRLKKEAQLRAEAAALEQQNIEDDEMEGEGKDEDENKSTSEIDIPAKRSSNNMQADIETDDYPLVSQALEEMYSNLGKIENQNIKVQNKDAVYTGNIQEKESGSTFRILRPLMDVATTREEAGKAYERKIEEERRKKEEGRRRKEEERRRKEEELRRKREAERQRKEAERQRKEDEKKRKKDEERQKKLELRYRQEEEQRRKKMDIQTRRKKEQEDIQARKGSGRNKNDKDNRKIWQGND